MRCLAYLHEPSNEYTTCSNTVTVRPRGLRGLVPLAPERVTKEKMVLTVGASRRIGGKRREPSGLGDLGIRGW